MLDSTNILYRYASERPIPVCIRKFFSTTHGAAAVEFALVSLPFFLLLAGTIQWAFIIWARMNLDVTVENAVRNLFTGTFQTANAGVSSSSTLLTNLKATMCGSGTNTVPTVFTCGNVKLNVSISSSFAGGSYTAPYDATTKAISTNFEGYTCASPGQIVVVTAAVTIPTFFGRLIPGLTGMADGSYLLTSRDVFRTEPYSTASSSSC